MALTLGEDRITMFLWWDPNPSGFPMDYGLDDNGRFFSNGTIPLPDSHSPLLLPWYTGDRLGRGSLGGQLFRGSLRTGSG